MVSVFPTILSNDLQEVEKLIHLADGVTERVQIDIIDGKFADNITIKPNEIKYIKASVKVDFHLMVDDPERWLKRCKEGHAARAIAQIEKMRSQMDFIARAKMLNLVPGFALDIDTQVSQIEPTALKDLGLVQIVSVKAGLGGQRFDARVIEKIKKLSRLRSELDLDFVICDDGGVTKENIDELYLNEVNEVVVGKRIFEGDLSKNIMEYKEASYA